jgi:hypothetical protein
MYYSSNVTRTPKNKITAKVVLADGDLFEGCLFLTGDWWVSDLLNGESDFIPFETLNGEIYILNRRMISHVMPREADAQNVDDNTSEVDSALKEIAENIQTKVA